MTTGADDDWRYVQVRRALIYIEQSIRAALDRFTFAPNDADTWAAVVSVVSSFLDSMWSQGGLIGNSPSESYTARSSRTWAAAAERRLAQPGSVKNE